MAERLAATAGRRTWSRLRRRPTNQRIVLHEGEHVPLFVLSLLTLCLYTVRSHPFSKAAARTAKTPCRTATKSSEPGTEERRVDWGGLKQAGEGWSRL